jgi:hypothetical protein
VTTDLALALLLAGAVVTGWVRLAWWYARAARADRPRPWRLAALAVLQPAAAALLYATLLPPRGPVGARTLVVATAGAGPVVAIGPGERLVALPEAGRVLGARGVPDLGTAIRQEGTDRLRIVGTGLERRDREAAIGASLRFDPPPAARGLVALTLPATVLQGAVFPVVARAPGVTGIAELLDPAGRVVDARSIGPDGGIALSGTARGAGAALFAIRLRDGGKVVERADVPVVVGAQPTARVLILAGAPGPEVKFLRRWAIDAGLSPQVRAEVGGGVALGDPVSLSAGTLAATDVLILDDRRWADLGPGGRGAVAAAVRGGMGLVVRITGPLPRGWQAAGLAVAAGSVTAPVVLPPSAPSEDSLAARRGVGTRDRPIAAAGARDAVPVLTRQTAVIGGARAVPLLRDARGAVFAGWQASGRGRVAAISLHDSFALVTSGHGDRFAELWSGLVSAVARPRAGTLASIDPLPRAGERMVICGAGDARVMAPTGSTTELIMDPAAPGCAGYWPAAAGWHRLTGPAARPFFVHAAASLSGVRATERAEATRRLVGERNARGASTPGERGSPWPWFAGWLLTVGLLWWLERARIGRGRSSARADALG